ncbi:peptide chain release factor N(5)-glutamine methyltransferase [Ferrimonas lipolytica]|uniref:Release factor glutamine methyltransferase n=1 Tax=Ferrimonas lipolytica TaxID=2724191 RepID=A0A6H1UDG6_9GAMM|nr:peptide chain release factor N(5)-glutamine methyltransferase [Ferrimonas lipolytica]QIZ77084.1 peptide chain release factor N(5)-glutamine methyltransferase [Ferrimonas lipolytica]
MRLDLWLAHAAKQLTHSDSAALDAELLLLFCINKPRSFVFTWPDHPLDEATLMQLQSILQRRINGEPIAHIIGQREFWSLPLQVNASTLIPRPDTESLVEAALGLALPHQAAVVDLGTGTGAIALALKSEMAQWQVEAVEFSAEAVQLARANAAQLNLAVEVSQGSWFEPVQNKRFDLVVSNPPYIDPTDHHLDQGDVRFEPLSALIADNHGLADIEHIVATAPRHLNQGGYLMIEHGYDQGAVVKDIFERAGFANVRVGQDYGQRDRYTLGQWQC